VASQVEATILALPLKASLALLCRALFFSEATIASLLALSIILSLASRLRSLAVGADSESDAELATLLVNKGALALASHDRRG